MNRERLHRITVEAGKCGGRPCIRGQRIRVSDVLQLLGAGASFDEIQTDLKNRQSLCGSKSCQKSPQIGQFSSNSSKPRPGHLMAYYLRSSAPARLLL